MNRLDETALRALRLGLDRQPLSSAKVTFAWQVAAGPTMGRAAAVRWADGRLTLETETEAWRAEIVRAAPTLLRRLNDLLGTGTVSDVTVVNANSAARGSSRTRGWPRPVTPVPVPRGRKP